jgi:hypothetical protein
MSRIARALLLILLLSPAPAGGAASIVLPPVEGFVRNAGQAPGEVLYYAAVPGGALFLTRDALILDSWAAGAIPATAPATRGDGEVATRRVGRVVRASFLGAGGAAIVESAEQGDVPVHLFLGNDPAAWSTGVRAAESVTYRELWPGVDLSISASAAGVALALDVRPGALGAAARFRIEGADDAPAIADVATLQRLVNDALGHRRLDDVALDDALGGSALDDPGALAWSSFLGGSAEEIGWSAVLDSEENVVVAGLNTSTFFPTTPGAYDEVYSGLGDVFVSKISADGSTLLWSTFLGGTALLFDYGYAVTLDENDNPIVTGYTRSEDFPATAGAYDTDHNGEADVFVSKLSAAGDALLWSTFLGGESHDIGYDVDLDAESNPVVAGRTLSFGFPATPGAYDEFPDGEEEGFIAKLSASGGGLVWSTFLGGTLYDGVTAIELDASDAPLVCGHTSSPDFPAGAANGLYDIFAAKLSAGGDQLAWSRLVGGSSYDYGTDLALDATGNPVVCGSTGSFDFPVTAGAYDESYNGDDDVVAFKLAGADGGVAWATFAGGTAPVYEIAHGVGVDAAGRPILAGATPSADFPTTGTGYDASHNGASDAFVLRLDANGSQLEWGSFLGSAGDDYAFALALASDGDVVVTGSAAAGFPATAGAYDASYNGDVSDVFASRLTIDTDPTGVPAPARPGDLALAVFPNPVSSTTRVAFVLAAPAPARIELFDAAGRRRAALDAGVLAAGAHAFDWSALARSGEPLGSGIYAARATAGGVEQTARVVLLR